MLEGASEAGEAASCSVFQIGDSVTAFTYPLTEGLIISRTITDDVKLELTIIVAPYKKRGQTWSRASVVTRDAARLSKKMPSNFNFPIKNVEVLCLKAKNAKGDSAWAFAICVALDRDFCGNSYGSGVSESEDHEEEKLPVKESRMTANQIGTSEIEISDKKQDLLDSRVEEVVQLKDKSLTKIPKGKERGIEILSDSDFVSERKSRKHARRRKKKRASRRKKVASSSDYSGSSSSPTSDSSRASGEVGEKGRSGRFTCPFDEEDSRGFKDVKRQIKGQSVIRKHIRVALHNLYAEHHTMKSFADALISQANSSQYKPFSTDTSWLLACARYIDSVLLSSLRGPWALWDEPVLDDMVMGFLELVVRVSPHKEYPICLDDSIRKWMKKKRVGVNPKYGPVSYTMQHAKFTDCGPVIFQAGWQKQRERSFGRASSSSTPAKTAPNAQGG